MHRTYLKLPTVPVLFASALISMPVAHADPCQNSTSFVSTESSGEIDAFVSESVNQVLSTSYLTLQDTQVLLLKLTAKASGVVTKALDLIGIRYRWGGNTPKKGFDCSGFVHYIFQHTLGLTLPRSAAGMSRIGNKITVDKLKPGDLVFFNTRRRTFSHVGIFIGDNRFVHSPSTGNTVRIDSLNNRYWEKRFTGARRLEALAQMQPVSEAEQNDPPILDIRHTSS